MWKSLKKKRQGGETKIHLHSESVWGSRKKVKRKYKICLGDVKVKMFLLIGEDKEPNSVIFSLFYCVFDWKSI
jgi:hypothetical protein